MENSREDVIPKMNEELLKKPRSNPDDPPKRNTKDALIERIQQIADENNLEIMVSNTKLKRMSKPALQKLLGEMLNECMKKQMAETVKASGTSDSLIGLDTPNDARYVRHGRGEGAERISAAIRLPSGRVFRQYETTHGEQVRGRMFKGDCR